MYCIEEKKSGWRRSCWDLTTIRLKIKKKEYPSNLMLEGEMWHECTTYDEQLLLIYMR